MDLSVSIVIFHSPPDVIHATLESLARCADALRRRRANARIQLTLIDNAAQEQARLLVGGALGERLRGAFDSLAVLDGHGNIGYGSGHNLAIRNSSARYHLVLNPDVVLAEDALVVALEFLDAHPEAGLLAPLTSNPAGDQEFLCHRYPSLTVLAVRGFLPRSLRRPFRELLARYEMRAELMRNEVVWDPLLVSGCFMLFRGEVVRRIGGFDPRYFMYFEDYDLSLRSGGVARTVFAPSVRIVHSGGKAARKGLRHIRMFAASAWTFFNSHGWRLYSSSDRPPGSAPVIDPR